MQIKRRNITSGAHAWIEPVIIPTYPAGDPDRCPMFLEKRVYQGSSGKVYPLPFIDRVSHEKEDRVYEAIHLENEFLYLMILPEIGGRIHVALDKTNDYDFFYRQNVIKPALVGLAGPWISGGVEINWPQHHRPSTFMPCEFAIEQGEDGSVTVWLSEHEPMNRMKGMHGVRIRPGSTCVELLGRVYNRTPFTQTFLWWANVAVHVNDNYQSFFPPDVYYVADHAKRATSTFPECDGFYYGVDYGPGTRLDWYKNIPVPTSYMVVETNYDFFGGYDHGKRAGFVHVADRRIAPGKKQWTWGNHPFGWAWDRNLTDSDGPYVELMAGVFTDNQPDFSFLAPYETRTFKQTWFPIQGIGPATNANEHGAISIRIEGGEVHVGVCVTHAIPDGVVSGVPASEGVSLKPGEPWVRTFPAPADGAVLVSLADRTGFFLRAQVGLDETPQSEPKPATEPPLPEEIESLEELYLTGLHLEQYRHATRMPEPYWQEALRRDPGDSRCNTAMAVWRLRRGEYEEAEAHARKAIERLTRRNPNPPDGEAYYLLGQALERQGQGGDAIAAYLKATWNAAWAGAAHFRLGCLTSGRERMEHLRLCLRHMADNGAARCLLAATHRLDGRLAEARAEVMAVLAEDPLDHWALREAWLCAPDKEKEHRRLAYISAMRAEPQNYMDLAIDYVQAELFADSVAVLEEIAATGDPLVIYTLESCIGLANIDLPDYQWRDPKDHPPVVRSGHPLFPSRLEEIEILQDAASYEPFAAYQLGNILYDRRRHEEAIEAWERVVRLDPEFDIAWRNLGIAYFNVRHDHEKAQQAFLNARSANPGDARIAYELDQLRKRIGTGAKERLDEIDAELALRRDDFTLELCALYNDVGESEEALGILSRRQFAPWEGGEGVALGEWARTHLLLGQKALNEGRADAALEHFQAAENPPENLGEARHLLANASDVWYWLGEALNRLDRNDEAQKWWTRAAEFKGDFQEMSVRAFSEMTPFQALSLRRLGRDAEADKLLQDLLAYAEELEKSPAKVDYFATSLPTMLLFEDDLQERQTRKARRLQELAHSFAQK
ncbi:MAG TPA: DUF5107 domain-containing protein [Fimbriimonadaceae bacterium]|nr:DUF5107 domain-containing protein [Fimbriimonadaceae bacterium]